MNRLKAFAIASCLGLLFGLAPNATAGDFTKRTIVTLHEPVTVPGKLLTPGTYVMKLHESPSNRHIVEFFNEDESELQATVHAIPNRRIEPKGQTEFVFWETPPGQPRALRAWFYPGDHLGQEFQYSEGPPVVAQQPMLTTTIASIQTRQIEPPQEVAQVQPPPPPPEPEVQPEPPPPAPAPAPPPTLPRTASPFPLIGLAGLLSLGGAALLHAATRRNS